MEQSCLIDTCRAAHHSSQLVQATGAVASWTYEGLEFKINRSTLHLTLKCTLDDKSSDVLSNIAGLIENCDAPSAVRVAILHHSGNVIASEKSRECCFPGLEHLIHAIRALPMPVVFFADGHVGESACYLLRACDFVVADVHATFDGRLACRTNPDCYSQTSLTTQEAFQLGLVHEIASWPNLAAFVDESMVSFDKQPLDASCLKHIFQDRVFKPIWQEPVECAEAERHDERLQQDGMKKGGMGDFDSVQMTYCHVVHSVSLRSSPAVSSLEAHENKPKDHASLLKPHHGAITALMVRNLPCSITRDQLSEVVDSMGFREKYDWLYLPMKNRQPKAAGQQVHSRPSNLGYGFINFPMAEDARQFAAAFGGYTFKGTNSMKRCEIGPAHVQASMPWLGQKTDGDFLGS